MTDEEINIAIADHLGWEFRRDVRKWATYEPRGTFFHDSPPNYTRDLNAMHKAEMSLHIEGAMAANYDGSRSEFRDQLRYIAGQPIHATAKERAEAFLRTVGKWKEEA